MQSLRKAFLHLERLAGDDDGEDPQPGCGAFPRNSSGALRQEEADAGATAAGSGEEAAVLMLLHGSGGDASAGCFRFESEAYYRVSKVLHDVSTTPGLVAAAFTRDFLAACADFGSGERRGGDAQADAQSARRFLQDRRPMAQVASITERLRQLVEDHLVAPDESLSLTQSRGSNGSGVPAFVERLRPWLRLAVERSMYGRIGGALWQVYVRRYAAEDALFASRAEDLRRVPDEALLASLEVRPPFLGRGEVAEVAPEDVELGETEPEAECAKVGEEACAGPPTPSTEAPANSEDRGASDTPGDGAAEQDAAPGPGDQVCAGDGAEACEAPARLTAAELRLPPQLPQSVFARAAAALGRVEASVGGFGGDGSCTPGEAMQALELAQLEMKTGVMEVSRGKAELVSMDDIMPLFVYVLLRSGMRRPLACAAFIRDSLTPDQRTENEGRTVMLLECGAHHVVEFDWSQCTSQAGPCLLGWNDEVGAVEESIVVGL